MRGKANGFGIYRWSKGKVVYEGFWEQNKMQGNGTLTVDGDFYKGDWKIGRREGKGKLQMKNGDSYEGDWVNNLPHGRGTFISGTTKYSGLFKNGKPHGLGLLYQKNSTPLVVEYNKDSNIVDKKQGESHKQVLFDCSFYI